MDSIFTLLVADHGMFKNSIPEVPYRTEFDFHCNIYWQEAVPVSVADPDPSVRGTDPDQDPDLDPSITKQKRKKDLDSYWFL